MVTAQTLDFAPGDGWNYSNLGYLTLGLVIHKVTGEFYGNLLQKRIFNRLGMNDTRIISEAEIIPNRAAGYRLEGSEQEEKLRRSIAQLPENQRQVLMLRYYSDLKFVEIARILGCPLNTALGRAHKALLKLRELMAD